MVYVIRRGLRVSSLVVCDLQINFSPPKIYEGGEKPGTFKGILGQNVRKGRVVVNSSSRRRDRNLQTSGVVTVRDC